MLIICIPLLFGLFVSPVRADGWDDFTNNLATDLVPIITLFGEAVTKQFLSESLGIWDNFIFAMAPLGILTAVVSAIRVCGSPSLKAFIGRAQESAGSAEVELLSCTSETTAELWNDGGIVRVFGKPDILEFVKWDDDDDQNDEKAIMDTNLRSAEDNAGIDTLESVTAPLEENREKVNRGWKMLSKGASATTSFGGPNLSLNIGIKRRSQGWYYLAAFFGLVLQTAVLIFAALTVYVVPEQFAKSGVAVPSYGFPTVLTGTVLVCSGMFLCSYLIEQSTAEDYYENSGSSRLYWVQRGDQEIGDQVFGAFIAKLESTTYIKSSRAEMDGPVTLRLWAAVSMTTCGFVLQFVGLRALHSSITLFQLGSTLLMSIVRASLRTSRMKENQNLMNELPENIKNKLPGHELDFCAIHFGGSKPFGVCLAPSSTQGDSAVSSPDDENRGAATSQGSEAQTHISSSDNESRLDQPGKPHPNLAVHSATNNVLKYRERFATINALNYSDFKVKPDTRLVAEQLKRAIEESMEFLVSACLASHASRATESSWQIGIKYSSNRLPYAIRISKGVGTSWIVDNLEFLEAIIGLWAWSLILEDKAHNGRTARLVVDGDIHHRKYGKDDYQVWMQRRLSSREVEPGDYTDHIFGWPQSHAGIIVPTMNSIVRMCAQDIYVLFLDKILEPAKMLQGKITVRPGDNNRRTLQLENTRIEGLATAFEAASLGSREDGYMCIVPVLMSQSKIPSLKEAYQSVLRKGIRDDDRDIVTLMLDHGVDTARLDSEGRTALHYTAAYGKVATLKLLVDRGENIEAKNNSGWTPLHQACYKGKKGAVKFLIEQGADVNVLSNVHTTPLYVALLEYNDDVAKILICHKKTDLDLRSETGITPLILEASARRTVTTRLLIQNGANLKLTDTHGWTAGMRAWASRYKATIRLFNDFTPKRSPVGNPPECWTNYRRGTNWNINEDGMIAELPRGSEQSEQSEYMSLRADHPIPAGIFVYYFEVKILELTEDSQFAIGLTLRSFPRNQMAGLDRVSWGYHASNGRKYHTKKLGYPYGPAYKAGDTVGCGVDYRNWTAFFILNGKSLGTAFWGIKGRLVPMVSATGAGIKIQANFGKSEFAWKGLQKYKVDKGKPNKKAGDVSPTCSEADSSDTEDSLATSEWTDASADVDSDEDSDNDEDSDSDNDEDSDSDSDEDSDSDDDDDDEEDGSDADDSNDDVEEGEDATEDEIDDGFTDKKEKGKGENDVGSDEGAGVTGRSGAGAKDGPGNSIENQNREDDKNKEQGGGSKPDEK